MRFSGLTVTNRSADEACGELCVPTDEPFFAGHFPSYPLVPGVVLIDAAVQVASACEEQPRRLCSLSEARFYDEVRPEDRVFVRVVRNGAMFDADVRRGDKLCATMSFLLEAVP